MLRSEEVASDRYRDTRPARRTRFLTHQRRAQRQAQPRLDPISTAKGCPKDLSKANHKSTDASHFSAPANTPLANAAYTTHLHSTLQGVYLGVGFRRVRGGRFVGPQDKTVVLSVCHRFLCILRLPGRRVREEGCGIYASSGGALYACSICVREKLSWLSNCPRVLGRSPLCPYVCSAGYTPAV